MMKNIMSYGDFALYLQTIFIQMARDNYKPQHIITGCDSGVILATHLSNYFSVDMTIIDHTPDFWDMDQFYEISDGREILLVRDYNDQGLNDIINAVDKQIKACSLIRGTRYCYVPDYFGLLVDSSYPEIEILLPWQYNDISIHNGN